MKMILIRQVHGGDFTLGELFIDDKHFCYTCEDAVRTKKIKRETAIPAGVYEVTLTWSNRFQKVLPLLNDVPEFTGVRIHSGNTKEDTEGCILVGLGRTSIGVSASRDAMAKLMPLLHEASERGEPIEIEIV